MESGRLSATSMDKPEELARQHIDEALREADWAVQDLSAVNLHEKQGVLVRNFSK